MFTYATLHIEAICLAVILFVTVITYLVVKFKNIGFIFSTLIYVLGYFVLYNIISCSIVEYITYFALPSLVLSLLTISIFEKKEKGKSKDNPFRIEFLDESKKKFYWEDINTGVAISGASGAGKTASVIYFLLKHYAKHSFAGIIYDYKFYELTEIAYPLFKKQNIKVNIFSPADVNRSIRINPIAPQRMNNESSINSLVSTFVMNLSQSDASSEASKFFKDGCESLIAGVIWRLKKDYPEKCNLPFLTAFLLAADNHHEKFKSPEGITLTEPFKKLVDWICKDPRAELAASVFLTGLSNSRQTGSLYSTLAAALRKIASPEIFYLLGADEVPLDLNADDNRSVISIVNDPSETEEAISPILATVVDACLSQMSKRGRKPSFVLLDEAPTIKIMNLAKRIATLRSYGFSFVYCLQDMVQAVAQWDGKKYVARSILAQ
ncbi:MAG: type IV secretory system conjugative DNA transfer family protein [Dysgonomonas sp.]